MHFIALADFNSLRQSTLPVSPSQQQSDGFTRKLGLWMFGFGKGSPTCFRLPNHTAMAFLVPNCDLSVCHTGEAQSTLLVRTLGDIPVPVEGDGAVA